MPKWKPAPAPLVSLFAGAIGSLPAVEAKKMFGYPAAFLNGNMMAGLFQDQMILRLSAPDRDALLRTGGTPFAPMGRTMREYVVVPETVLDSAKDLGAWLRKSASYVGSLPAKQPKARGKSKAPKVAARRK